MIIPDETLEIDLAISTILPSDCQSITLLNVSQEVFDNLIFPSNLIQLIFYSGELSYLKIPEGCQYVVCSCLGLTELYMPDSLEIIYCDNNDLTEIELPPSIQSIDANYNRIRNIKVRVHLNNLYYINLKKNKLKSINFYPPPMLTSIDVDTYVVIPEEFNIIIEQNNEKMWNNRMNLK
jgi:hypothetical protein